jgi:hypothetical protein
VGPRYFVNHIVTLPWKEKLRGFLMRWYHTWELLQLIIWNVEMYLLRYKACTWDIVSFRFSLYMIHSCNCHVCCSLVLCIQYNVLLSLLYIIIMLLRWKCAFVLYIKHTLEYVLGPFAFILINAAYEVFPNILYHFYYWVFKFLVLLDTVFLFISLKWYFFSIFSFDLTLTFYFWSIVHVQKKFDSHFSKFDRNMKFYIALLTRAWHSNIFN